MIKILFICHGNICRSPMAEMVMKHMVKQAGLTSAIYIESAATSREEIGNGIHYGTRRKLQQEAIPCYDHRAIQVTKADYEKYDLLIVMDSYNIRNLMRIIGNDTDNKVSMLLDFAGRQGQSIADPWYTGDFDETYRDVKEGCEGLLQYILERQFEAVLDYATKKHEGQLRKGGEPYITHPIAVAEMLREKGFGIDYQMAGLCHDLLEDTDATEEEIARLAGERVLEAVKLLTKPNKLNMSNYIRGIRANQMAYEVKAADRLHNLQCAVDTNTEFKQKYITESKEWYMDFGPEIVDVIKELEESL